MPTQGSSWWRSLSSRECFACFPQAEELSAQVLSGVHAFEDIYSAGLALAGLGYAVDSFGIVLFAGHALEVATFTFVGEVVLISWLLFRGRRLTSRP